MLRDLPVHPFTGLSAIGLLPGGRPVWPVAGAAEEGDTAPSDDSPGDTGGQAVPAGSDTDNAGSEDGTGDDTATLEAIKALAADLGVKPGQLKGRLEASRKWEERAKSNTKAVKELEELKRSQMSEQDKAVDEARTSARADALREVGGRLVDADIKSAAAGRVEPGQMTVLLEHLDRSKFLTDDGEVDTAKVTSYVDGIAGKPPTNGNGNGSPRIDLGQGRRGSTTKPSVDSGAALYAQRHSKQTQ